MLFKVITTITWQIDSDKDYEECLKEARNQVQKIVDCEPDQSNFENYNIQLDLVRMRDRHKLQHLKRYEPQEILSLVSLDNKKHEFVVGETTYKVRLNHDRYFLFAENPNCSACGLKGSHMYLDANTCDHSTYFNLYGEESGRLVIMTIDHQLAKSKGGANDLSNYQTMCAVCNNLKGNDNLTLEQVAELREVFKNSQHLPKNKIKSLIHEKKLSMKVITEYNETSDFFSSFSIVDQIPDVIVVKF